MKNYLKMLTKHANLLIAGICLASLIFVLAMQHIFQKQPCSACIVDRMLVLGIFVFSLMAQIKQTILKMAFKGLQWVGALGTLAFAAYHTDVLLSPGKTCATTISEFILNLNMEYPSLNWLFEAKVACGQGNDYFLGVLLPIWVAALAVVILIILILEKIIRSK